VTDKHLSTAGNAPPSADQIAVDYVQLLAALAMRRTAADRILLQTMAYVTTPHREP
jgi:hypothetical protein